uniref:Uncharacterized protein n=1 Tax=Ixodes ricinus TaxID=34613 RepID=A0A6B0UG00_IXORI
MNKISIFPSHYVCDHRFSVIFISTVLDCFTSEMFSTNNKLLTLSQINKQCKDIAFGNPKQFHEKYLMNIKAPTLRYLKRLLSRKAIGRENPRKQWREPGKPRG